MTFSFFIRLLLLDTLTHAVGQTVTLPSSSTAVEGDSFRLTCTVTGGPDPPTGLLIFSYGSTDACLVNSADCSQVGPKPRFSCGAVSCGSVQTRVYFLDINPVSRQDDRDDWKCQYNEVSSTGRLTVNYPSSITSSFPSIYTVIEQKRLNIDCSAYTAPGQPTATSYEWIHPDGSTTVTSVLDISSISRSQRGQYKCTAINTLSPGRQGKDNATVDVTVQYGPTILEMFPPSLSVAESSPIHINCSTYTTPGNPRTTSYVWTGPNSFTSNSPLLSISSIVKSQAGQYTCTATNTLTPTDGSQETRSDKAQVDIRISAKPSISGIPKPYHVTENTNLQLDCRVYTQSNPAVDSYRWSGPGGYSSNGPVLSITNINRDKSGQYTCTATNSIGTGTGQTMVDVQWQLTQLKHQTQSTQHAAFADGTHGSLRTQWQTYLMFCAYFGLLSTTASQKTLCLYAQFLGRSFISITSVKNYLNGVKLWHMYQGLNFPSVAFTLRLTLRGLGKHLFHQPVQAAAIFPTQLLAIWRVMCFDSPMDCTLFCLFMFAFFLMARKSTLIPPTTAKFAPYSIPVVVMSTSHRLAYKLL